MPEHQPDRPLFSRRDGALLAGILGAAALLFGGFALFSGHGTTARVRVDGREVASFRLEWSRDQIIPLEEFGVEMELEIRDHAIRVRSSSCPDQLCVGFGWLRREPQSAVCLPNRVSVSVE